MTGIPETWDDRARRALTFARMQRWATDLDDRIAKARLLVECGAPDPKFGELIEELETFKYCCEVLAFSTEAREAA